MNINEFHRMLESIGLKPSDFSASEWLLINDLTASSDERQAKMISLLERIATSLEEIRK